MFNPAATGVDSRTRRRLSRQQKRERHRSTNIFAKLSQEKIQLYKEVFSMIDQDGDGAISKQDLKSILTSLGANDVSEDRLMQMLMQCNGTLNFTAFLAMFAQMTSEMDKEETIENAFSILDNGKGQMDALEFHRLLTTVGYERLTQDEANNMLQKATIDANGMFDVKKLSNILTFKDGE